MLSLLNKYERITFEEITRVGRAFGLTAYPKVRVADVLPIDDGRTRSELKAYALKAHFDFVVCRNNFDPQYVVEFDGKAHRAPVQVRRDAQKNALCRLHKCPILRINSNHIGKRYLELTLLSWIMEVYELKLSFIEAQERGQVPDEECFDPIFIYIDGKPSPYHISRPSIDKLRKYYERGLVTAPFSSGFIGSDASHNLFGIEHIEIRHGLSIAVKTAMRSQDFPIDLSDLLAEILTIQLGEAVDQYLANRIPPQSTAEVGAEVKRYMTRFDLCRSHSYSIGR